MDEPAYEDELALEGDEDELVFLGDCSHGDEVQFEEDGPPFKVSCARARWEGKFVSDPGWVVVVDRKQVPHNHKADLLVCRIQKFTYNRAR